MSGPLTSGEVHAALGLEPPVEYARKVMDQTGSERGSGRTTRTLCTALAAASQGQRIRIIGHSLHYTLQLTRTLRAMALSIGIDPALVVDVRANDFPPRDIGDRNPPRTYWDHHDP